MDWFSEPDAAADFVAVYLGCLKRVDDFETYLNALVELHKRRRKYAMILSRQPLPKMVQVAPRALLEFGVVDTPALASWLTWRKWFYDIDNRAAQETGLFFEPILASALGGASYASGKSPVRRRSDAGKGRQVDCIVDRTAYEFKLRVTPAASGQGRFGEELEEQAGPTMATFVEKYVRRPIAEIDRHAGSLLDLQIARGPVDGAFVLSLHDQTRRFDFPIRRREDASLAGDAETPES